MLLHQKSSLRGTDLSLSVRASKWPYMFLHANATVHQIFEPISSAWEANSHAQRHVVNCAVCTVQKVDTGKRTDIEMGPLAIHVIPVSPYWCWSSEFFVQPLVMERITDTSNALPDGEASWIHTKALYRLTDESRDIIKGCTSEMCMTSCLPTGGVLLPEECGIFPPWNPSGAAVQPLYR